MNLPQHIGGLEHHIFEVVAFQWDGDKDEAERLLAELYAEMRIRDAEVTRFQYTIRLTRGIPTLRLTVRRRADGAEFPMELMPGDWAAFWLHEQRLYLAQEMREAVGESFFRRMRPVVVLGRREIGVDG